MEKTITIDGKEVSFKATGGIGYRYKAQFGREFLEDVVNLDAFVNSGTERLVKKKLPSGKLVAEKVTDYDYSKLSLESMYNLLWTLAKTADENIPDPQKWLDSFDVFPVMNIYTQIQDLLGDNFKVSPKNE